MTDLSVSEMRDTILSVASEAGRINPTRVAAVLSLAGMLLQVDPDGRVFLSEAAAAADQSARVTRDIGYEALAERLRML